MTTDTLPSCITPGLIASHLGVPLHRVIHILATRAHICPRAKAGRIRLYSLQAVAMVRHEINAQDARRCDQGED